MIQFEKGREGSNNSEEVEKLKYRINILLKSINEVEEENKKLKAHK